MRKGASILRNTYAHICCHARLTEIASTVATNKYFRRGRYSPSQETHIPLQTSIGTSCFQKVAQSIEVQIFSPLSITLQLEHTAGDANASKDVANRYCILGHNIFTSPCPLQHLRSHLLVHTGHGNCNHNSFKYLWLFTSIFMAASSICDLARLKICKM